jgi:hypothetical protein
MNGLSRVQFVSQSTVILTNIPHMQDNFTRRRWFYRNSFPRPR